MAKSYQATIVRKQFAISKKDFDRNYERKIELKVKIFLGFFLEVKE